MSIRRNLLAASAVLAIAGTAAGGTATAATARPFGYSAVMTCNLKGALNLSPKLSAVTHSVGAGINGATLSGCNYNGTNATDTGSLFVSSISGTASKTQEILTGNFTVVWPASAGLNPSYGTFSINEVNGAATVSDYVSSGAYANAGLLNASWTVTSHHAVTIPGGTETIQNFAGQLKILENFG